MNRKLTDPFKSVALPEVIEEYLDYGVAKCCAFNRRGTLLATGTEDGYIVIWDFETRGVAKVLPGHSAQNAPQAADGGAADEQQQQQQQQQRGAALTVTCLAWSRNGRHLLSGSLDKRVILWDVLQGTQVCEVALPSGVARVSLSPRRPYRAVASLFSTAPCLVDLDARSVTPLPSVDFKADRAKGAGRLSVLPNPSATGVALLTRDGGEVLLGQLRGVITVYDAATARVVDVVRLPSAVKVMSLTLNRQGTLLLANCSDKVVRLFELARRPEGAPTYALEELEAAMDQNGALEAGRAGSLLLPPGAPMLRASPVSFQNAVERNPWRGVALNGDSEHVVGAVASKDEHRLYIWSRLYGKLERILEGPKTESTVDIAWHPTTSTLLSLSSTGRVYIWAQIYDENWSAFAPDFQELDENQEYVEQEDEFDINQPPGGPPGPHGTAHSGGGGGKPGACGEGEGVGQGEEDVDVLTREALRVFSSDEEDEGAEGSEEPLYWLPAEVALVEGAGPGPQEQREQEQESSEEEEESEESEGRDKRDEDSLILDRPRDRKRRVRFQDYSEGGDDDGGGPAPRGGGRGGRGRGRRGRPPKYAGTGAAPGRGGGGGGGGGGVAYGLGAGGSSFAAAPAGMFGGPGSALNGPAGHGQQQPQQQMLGMLDGFGGALPGGQLASGMPQQPWPGLG